MVLISLIQDINIEEKIKNIQFIENTEFIENLL